jgi:hypothetical protein
VEEEDSSSPSSCVTDEGKSKKRIMSTSRARSGGVTIQYPMLEGDNYGMWAAKMKVFMRAQGVWTAIEGNPKINETKDEEAFAVIAQAVPNGVFMTISQKDTAKEAWDTIKEMHAGDNRVKKARVQALRREFDWMSMKEDEGVGEFALKLTSMVNEMRALGSKIEDTTVVEKLLRAVPDKFLTIVGTIEQWGDVENMSVMEVIGRLKTYELTLKGRERDKEEEQLMFSRAKGKDKKKDFKFDISKVRCYNCQELGHFSRECRNPRREQKKEHGNLHLAKCDNDDDPRMF